MGFPIFEGGAQSDKDIEHFIVKHLLKGINIDLGITPGSCSAFATQDAQGQRMFACNFDLDYTPSLVLETKPKDGYASISTVNLAFAEYGKTNLPKPWTIRSLLTLAAFYFVIRTLSVGPSSFWSMTPTGSYFSCLCETSLHLSTLMNGHGYSMSSKYWRDSAQSNARNKHCL